MWSIVGFEGLYVQVSGKNKGGWEHRTRITGAARPEEVLPKVIQPISGRKKTMVSNTVYPMLG